MRLFTRWSTSFASHQNEQMARLCQGFKHDLWCDMSAFVVHKTDAPLLVWSCVGATPITTMGGFDTS